MRNRISHRKLGRTSAHRTALFRNLVDSLVKHERIRTTLEKAKEIRRHAEWLISWAKRDSPTYATKVRGYMRSPETASKVFSVLAPRYKCVCPPLRRARARARTLLYGTPPPPTPLLSPLPVGSGRAGTRASCALGFAAAIRPRWQ